MQNTFQCRPIVNTSTCPARIFPSPTLMLPTSPISRRVGATQRHKPRCWVDGFWQCWMPMIINTHQGWVQSSLNLQLSLFQLQRGSEGVLSFLRWRIYGNPETTDQILQNINNVLISRRLDLTAHGTPARSRLHILGTRRLQQRWDYNRLFLLKMIFNVMWH